MAINRTADLPMEQEVSLGNGNANRIIPGIGQTSIFKMEEKWLRDYKEASGRTVLIANNGAHFHSLPYFKKMLGGFIDYLSNTRREMDDIVFFRSTSPGHLNCANYTSGLPLESHTEYERRFLTSKYAWDLFQEFNAHAAREIEGRRHLFYLNIYNMTALRPDGHVSAVDCLHYDLPSVIDWWNHMMYSSLVDFIQRNEVLE